MSIGFNNRDVARNLSKSNFSEMMGMEIKLELTGKQMDIRMWRILLWEKREEAGVVMMAMEDFGFGYFLHCTECLNVPVEKEMENVEFPQEMCLKTSEYKHFPWLSWAECLSLDKWGLSRFRVKK